MVKEWDQIKSRDGVYSLTSDTEAFYPHRLHPDAHAELDLLQGLRCYSEATIMVVLRTQLTYHDLTVEY